VVIKTHIETLKKKYKKWLHRKEKIINLHGWAWIKQMIFDPQMLKNRTKHKDLRFQKLVTIWKLAEKKVIGKIKEEKRT
jgi:hypothetical protein